jgi:hypothetical protein
VKTKAHLQSLSTTQTRWVFCEISDEAEDITEHRAFISSGDIDDVRLQIFAGIKINITVCGQTVRFGWRVLSVGWRMSTDITSENNNRATVAGCHTSAGTSEILPRESRPIIL